MVTRQQKRTRATIVLMVSVVVVLFGWRLWVAADEDADAHNRLGSLVAGFDGVHRTANHTPPLIVMLIGVVFFAAAVYDLRKS